MRIKHDVSLSLDPALERLLDRAISTLIHNQEKIMALLDQLTTDVATLTTVNQSAITLINGLAQQIKDAGTDPAALKALTDQMEAQTTALATAVTANTAVPPTA